METRDGMAIGTHEFAVVNDKLKVGDAAPDFKLTANNWTPKTLADYTGKVKILSIVPSLDTRVCSAQTHRFNREASALSEHIVVLTVSADLPYAQSRWCGVEGVDRVVTLSDHKDMNFSSGYGVHVSDLRICQRAAFVVDQHNVVQYAEYVPNIGDEINFDAVLAKVKSLV
ncbi:MAG: thiol peroxidase [Chloroflexi bacterium]|nr:thiol peroxidase [Chloroflexota bacterium]MCC6895597.1 thiol peroxidase [Anaerolineae bacterium]